MSVPCTSRSPIEKHDWDWNPQGTAAACRNCECTRVVPQERGGGSTKRQTPRLEGSCFLVVDSLGVVAGTCFAVSEELLLSSLHILEENVQFFLCKSIRRIGQGQIEYPNGSFPLKIVAKGDANISDLDFVVMELINKGAVALIPIPLRASPPKMEEEVKLYHAFGAMDFNQFDTDQCGIGVQGYEKISFVSNTHVFMAAGKDDGTSGGPYITRNGSAVALQLESKNRVIDVNAAKEGGENDKAVKSKKRMLVAHVNTRVDVLNDVVSHISNTHTSKSCGLTITSCGTLCEYLRDRGVVFTEEKDDDDDTQGEGKLNG